MKESENNFFVGLEIILLGSWLFVGLMVMNGHNQSGSVGWELISGLRWLATAVASGWALIHFVPQWWKEQEIAEQRRKDAYEQAINNEVEKRLQAIRKKEWEEKEENNRIEEKRKEKERKRQALEDQWRKEFEQKIEEESRLKRTAAEATTDAFNEFV